jgi:hypothetical protein
LSGLLWRRHEAATQRRARQIPQQGRRFFGWQGASASDFAAAAAPLPIAFRKASLSQESLYALETRLDDATLLLRKEGVLIATSMPQMETGRLRVQVLHLKAGDREKIATSIHSDLLDLSNTSELATAANTHPRTTKASQRDWSGI